MDNTNNYYLTSDQIYEEWRKWKETKVISDKMGEYMMIMATHVMDNKSFCRYPQDMKDEMIQECILKIERNLKNMKEGYRGCFFAYWTRCCFTAATTYLAKHYRGVNLKREMLLDKLQQLQTSSPTMVNPIMIKQLKEYIDLYNKPDSSSDKLESMNVE